MAGAGPRKLLLIAISWTLIMNFAGFIKGTESSNDGLVAYYSFDEGHGNIAYDHSGNGNDGTIYGATWVDGIKGKALYFDGENDYVIVENSNTISITGDITLAAWIYLEEDSFRRQAVVAKTTGGDFIEANAQYLLEIRDYGDVMVGHEYGEGLDEYNYVFDANLLSYNWYFVAVTRNIYLKEWKLYVNGEYQGTIHYSYNPNGGSQTKLDIGFDKGCPNTYFHGIIDELRIYNRALSESEIKALYDEVMNPQPVLRITKSVSRSTLQEGETVTVTLRIENTGNGNAYDVVINDELPSGFELMAGKNVAHYERLKSGEYKIIQYTLKAIGNGKFVLEPATVEYKDSNNDIYTSSSNSATINVLTKSRGVAENPLLLIIAIASISIVAIIGVVAIVILKRKT